MSGRRPLLNWLHRLDRVFSGHNEKVKKGKMKDGSTFITTYHWAKELFHRVGVYKYRNFSPLTRAFSPLCIGNWLYSFSSFFFFLLPFTTLICLGPSRSRCCVSNCFSLNCGCRLSLAVPLHQSDRRPTRDEQDGPVNEYESLTRDSISFFFFSF